MKSNKSILVDLKHIKHKVEIYITLKRYLFMLLGLSVMFFAIGEIKSSFIMLVFGILGLIFHDKLKEELE